MRRWITPKVAPHENRDAALTPSPGGSESIQAVLRHGQRRLRENGIESALLDTMLLLESATGHRRETLIGHDEEHLTPEAQRIFEVLLARRLAREPMAQILGFREFWSRPFRVTRDTLAPRPETEHIIEAALALVPRETREVNILDLGTGTGCILLTLLSEYAHATGTGVDISPGALAVAHENAASLGIQPGRVRLHNGDWLAGVEGRFNLIVSNPPYIASQEISRLAPEVACFEPEIALNGGVDGLDAYRALAANVPRQLSPGGFLILEIGKGQETAVRTLFDQANLQHVRKYDDLAGIARIVCFTRPL